MDSKKTIRAYLALARIAMRACLTHLTKRRGAGREGIDDNLLATTSNNIAVLCEKSNNGKESPLDAATRIPSVVASTSGASSTTGAALLGAPPPSLAGNGTPHQLRTALYNLALLLAREGEGSCVNPLWGSSMPRWWVVVWDGKRRWRGRRRANHQHYRLRGGCNCRCRNGVGGGCCGVESTCGPGEGRDGTCA